MSIVMSIEQSVMAFDRLELVSSSKLDDHEKKLKGILKDLDKAVDEVSECINDPMKLLANASKEHSLDIDKDRATLKNIVDRFKYAIGQMEKYAIRYNTKSYFKAAIDEYAPKLMEKIDSTLDNLYMMVEDLELGLKHGKQFEKLAILMDEYVSKTPIETIEVKDLFD